MQSIALKRRTTKFDPADKHAFYDAPELELPESINSYRRILSVHDRIGLCNRLQGIVSAGALASILDIPFILSWIPSSECDAQFLDLFDYVDDWRYESRNRRIAEYAALKDTLFFSGSGHLRASRWYEGQACCYPFWAWAATDLYYQLVKDRLTIDEWHACTARIREKLTPRDHLREAIKTDSTKYFNADTFGVHIRRTDRDRDLRRMHGWCTTDEELIKAIRNEPGNFFLATDNRKSRELIQSEFGDRVLPTRVSFDNADGSAILRHTGIGEAVYDLFMLAQTRKVLATMGSSFSNFAGDLGDIEVVRVGEASREARVDRPGLHPTVPNHFSQYDKLEEKLLEFPDDVIVAVVNFAYVKSGLLENWLQSVIKVGLLPSAIVVCLDDETKALLSSRSIPAWLWNVPTVETTSGAPVFGSDAFRNLTMQKLGVVQYFLQHGKNVLFTDVDIVFLKNPLQYLRSRAGDIQFQSDSAAYHKEDDGAEFESYCTGFYYARPTESVIRLLDTEREECSEFDSDQSWIQHRLKDNELEVELLPRAFFPNGNYWRYCCPPTPYMVHFNWCKGIETKIERLKLNGFWYVGENQGAEVSADAVTADEKWHITRDLAEAAESFEGLQRESRFGSPAPTIPGHDSIAGLDNLLTDFGPDSGTIIEFGTHRGIETQLLASKCKRCRVISVSGKTENEINQRLSALRRVELIARDELDPSIWTEDSVEMVYLGQRFEDREQLIQTLAEWVPKVSQGGTIAGHNYFVDSPETMHGLVEFFGTLPLRVYSDSSWVYVKR